MTLQVDFFLLSSGVAYDGLRAWLSSFHTSGGSLGLCFTNQAAGSTWRYAAGRPFLGADQA